MFAVHDGSDVALDIYRPPQDDAPVAIYVHGGGGRSGDKADDGARRLTPVVRLRRHRGGGQLPSCSPRAVPRPAARSERGSALAAREQPRLGLPTERIGTWGASAAAYLGSLLALTAGIDRFEGTVGGHFGQSSAVQAVVHWFGQCDLGASGARTEVEARLLPFAFEAGLLGVADITGAADRAQELSLLSWVSDGAPLFLIAHGDRDHIVLLSEGLALHHALVRAGAESRFELLGNAGHEGAEFDQPASLALTAPRYALRAAGVIADAQHASHCWLRS